MPRLHALLLAGLLAAARGFGKTPPSKPPSFLFSGTGTAFAQPGHTMTIVSNPANLIAFTDRPARDASSVTLAEVAAAFEAAGEEADPPNGVLNWMKDGVQRSMAIEILAHEFDEDEPNTLEILSYSLIGDVEGASATHALFLKECDGGCLATLFLDSIQCIIKLSGNTHEIAFHQTINGAVCIGEGCPGTSTTTGTINIVDGESNECPGTKSKKLCKENKDAVSCRNAECEWVAESYYDQCHKSTHDIDANFKEKCMTQKKFERVKTSKLNDIKGIRDDINQNIPTIGDKEMINCLKDKCPLIAKDTVPGFFQSGGCDETLVDPLLFSTLN